MSEVIILEDDPSYQGYMRRMVPEGVSCEIVGTSDALRACLAQNLNTTVFILDDRVPPSTEEKESCQFLPNAQAVLEAKPDAQIWYIGSSPGIEEFRFCSEKGIKMIVRTDIRDVLNKLKK